MRGSRLRGNDGGRSGVRRSGESFNSVAFGCIRLLSITPSPVPSPRGRGDHTGDRDALEASPSSSPSPLKGEGTCRGRPYPRLLPSREKGPAGDVPTIFARFWSFLSLTSPLPRAVVQECAGVGTPHTLARYGPIWPDLPLAAGTGDGMWNPHPRSLPRERGFPRLAGNDGGLNLGPIWPWLASFTPTVAAGNEANLASFGTPLTRTRWAGVALFRL